MDNQGRPQQRSIFLPFRFTSEDHFYTAGPLLVSFPLTSSQRPLHPFQVPLALPQSRTLCLSSHTLLICLDFPGLHTPQTLFCPSQHISSLSASFRWLWLLQPRTGRLCHPVPGRSTLVETLHTALRTLPPFSRRAPTSLSLCGLLLALNTLRPFQPPSLPRVPSPCRGISSAFLQCPWRVCSQLSTVFLLPGKLGCSAASSSEV